MKKLGFVLFLMLTQTVLFAQKRHVIPDHIGNFKLLGNQLEWQKNYTVEDTDELNQKLRKEPFTQGIDLLGNDGHTIVKGFTLDGENLPSYAREPYDALVIVDVFYDRIRVTVKQIVFPDFVDHVFYNGMRMNNSRGTLEHYTVNNGKIKRTTGALNVLNSFDTAFSTIFDSMLTPLPE